jgi:predicted DNA-binding protein (MmcQ/YjbR family)
MPRSPATEIRSYALSLPGAWEDHPWGESAMKVGKKVFVFMGQGGKGTALGLSVKLPESGFEALELPFAEPTGYGLGKGGWVTATFSSGEPVPVELLKGWVLESYRAIAPKKLAKELERRKNGRTAKGERRTAR